MIFDVGVALDACVFPPIAALSRPFFCLSDLGTISGSRKKLRDAVSDRLKPVEGSRAVRRKTSGRKTTVAAIDVK